MTDERIVVVGAGQAGVQVAESLRSSGYAGEVVLVGDEEGGPYHRPPLSKAWLAGEVSAAQLAIRAPEALAKKRIELRTGVAVARIDREARRVVFADGGTLEYRGLALATGASARPLTVPGADAHGVVSLRSRTDAQRIAEAFARCKASAGEVVVIGGGFIGLELAASARKQGLAVTVLEALPRLMARAVAVPVSDAFAALHAACGVRLVFGARVDAIETQGGAVSAVRTSDGVRHPAQLVIAGVGAVANDTLAREAGLACERGVIVDACARTSDPAIVAAGDCTARRLADGTLARLESVNNAVEQGRSAAAALLGQERPFVAAPWFWSDQFDVKLQIAGFALGVDREIVRGDLSTRKASVFRFAGARLLAVDSLNATADHLLARKLLDRGVSPTAEQAADTGFDLASLLPAG